LLAIIVPRTEGVQGRATRADSFATPIQHIAAYVAAPTTLATSMQASIAEQAPKHAVLAEDALTLLPPTRHYTDAEVRKALAERGVDGVLLITVADSGVVSQYAGTIFQASYSGTTAASGTTMPMGNGATATRNGMAQGEAAGAAKCREAVRDAELLIR
jgi:hypothetical protein